MKIILNKNDTEGLRDLVSIVIKDSGENLPDIIQYRGSSRKLIGIEDFAEYGLEFIPDKYKFNDVFPLEFLNDATKKMAGGKLSNIEKLEKVFFPTLSNTTANTLSSNNTYFGSVVISSQTLVMINIPKGYDQVYVYDKEISFFSDSWKLHFESTEEDSINLNKILWFIISPDGKVYDINISYHSWSESINPERNLNQYLLRNDDYNKINSGIDVIEKIPGTSFIVDKNSNTLLGNIEIENHPILDKKLTRDWYAGWKSGVNYAKDSVVIYKKSYYLKTSDKNNGSDPQYSGNFLKIIPGTPINRINPEKTSIRLSNQNRGLEISYKGYSWVFIGNIASSSGGIRPGTNITKDVVLPSGIKGSNSDWQMIPYSTYTPSRYYRKDEECKFNGEYWISLKNNNCNNLPGVSSGWWILSGYSKKFNTPKVNIIVTPGKGGNSLLKDFVLLDSTEEIDIPLNLNYYEIESVNVSAGEILGSEFDNGTYYIKNGYYFDNNVSISIKELDSIPSPFITDIPITSTRVCLTNSPLLQINLKKSKKEYPLVIIKTEEEPENLETILTSTNFYDYFKLSQTLDNLEEGAIYLNNISVNKEGDLINSSGEKVGIAEVSPGTEYKLEVKFKSSVYVLNNITSQYYVKEYPSTMNRFINRPNTDFAEEDKSEGNITSVSITDPIQKNGRPIFVVNLSTKTYLVTIEEYIGFEISDISKDVKAKGIASFTIKSKEHKQPIISIQNSETGEWLAKNLTPTISRIYPEGSTNPVAWIGSFLINSLSTDDGGTTNYTGWESSDKPNNLSEAVTEDNLTGEHKICINFNPDGKRDYSANYKIFVKYDNK